MRVLALETSTMVVGVAIQDEKGLMAESRFLANRSRAEQLMPVIKRVLKDIECSPQDLDGIAVSIGPGSFTGLRIGVSLAKGLTLALKIPVVGVDTLEALASSVNYGQSECLVCPLIDAKRGEVFSALFRVDGHNGFTRIQDDQVVSATKVIEELSVLNESILFLGTGAILYEEDLVKKLGGRATLVLRDDPFPSPARVARLGRARLLLGENDGSAMTPMYLSRFEPGQKKEGRIGLQHP